MTAPQTAQMTGRFNQTMGRFTAQVCRFFISAWKTIPLEFYEKSLKLIVQSAHALDETLDKLAKPMAP